MPKVLGILLYSVRLNIELGPCKSLIFYDVPSASLILVELFLIALAIHLGYVAKKINKKLKGYEKMKEVYLEANHIR